MESCSYTNAGASAQGLSQDAYSELVCLTHGI
ncbi:MAG: hypothetical protein RL014_2748 [Pseudomonadota bacterium]